jgi:GH15 family glucan-1,4-alpha-glucosidase
MAYKGIGQYGLIGNRHTAALVSDDGSIDWCCLPRFDSPSVFAAILDDDKGGRFYIRPLAPFTYHQEYLDENNVLETTFETNFGTATLTDFMPCYQTAAARPKKFDEIHRLVECIKGQMSLEVIFEPRLDYARGNTALSLSKYGVAATNGGHRLALSSLVPFEISGGRAVGRLELHSGQSASFVLRYGSDKPHSPRIYDTEGKLKKTTAYWQGKSDQIALSGAYRGAIVRSYLALHLLHYSPTGAILAAPTTSLPEYIGGSRNWDYRYAWLRDASQALNAFLYLSDTDEADSFMNWLMRVCNKCGPKAQILYDIEFKDPPPEQQLKHLSGYRNSRPVRIGNDAVNQFQLDIFGEVMECADTYLITGGKISRRNWQVLETFVDAACELWREPDAGIWEVRSGPFHFVHSKIQCWLALGRGIEMAEKLGHRRKLKRWRKAHGEIREDILARGWNPVRQAYTQHYDTTSLDAANLIMGIYGFLPPTDERLKSTIDRIVDELSWEGLLRRYNTDEVDDGLGGPEGAFLICSFWLVGNWLRQGRLEEAVGLYEKLLGYSNHLGLFSEMVYPPTGEPLGNFPQAYTHLAVIIYGLEILHYLEGHEKDER